MYSKRMQRACTAGTLAGLACFCLLSFTAQTIGISWDEPIYAEAAERAARWFGLLLRGNFSQAVDPYTFGMSWGLVHEHPPLMRFFGGLGWALTHAWLPAPLAHRIGAIALAALATGTMVSMVAYRRGLCSGLFAGAALLSMPRLFLHMHLNALDFPLAAVWVVGTLIFYGEMRRSRRHKRTPAWWPSLSSTLVVGAWIGLGLLTKINAVLLLPFWGLWILLYRRTWQHLLTYALSLPVGLLVLVAGWPWIWKDPVTGLWNWLQFFRIHFEIRQWFAGYLYVDTPWYLSFVIVLITTPVLVLMLAGIGAVTGEQRSRGAEKKRESGTGSDALRTIHAAMPGEWSGLHLLGMAVILGYYALPFTPIHDQDRLLLPAFAHLAILSGDGFDRLWHWIIRRRPFPRQWGLRRLSQVILALLLLAPGLVQSVRLHPYQLAYYNELVGGVTGARRLDLETIYFATTYAHFLPQLNELPAGSTIWVVPNSWDVLHYYQKYDLLRDDLVVLRPPGWGSFYDDQGVSYQAGTLNDAGYALLERRQTTFNQAIPEYAGQLTWATEHPELARLERNGVVLATLHGREGGVMGDKGSEFEN